MELLDGTLDDASIGAGEGGGDSALLGARAGERLSRPAVGSRARSAARGTPRPPRLTSTAGRTTGHDDQIATLIGSSGATGTTGTVTAIAMQRTRAMRPSLPADFNVMAPRKPPASLLQAQVASRARAARIWNQLTKRFRSAHRGHRLRSPRRSTRPVPTSGTAESAEDPGFPARGTRMGSSPRSQGRPRTAQSPVQPLGGWTERSPLPLPLPTPSPGPCAGFCLTGGPPWGCARRCGRAGSRVSRPGFLPSCFLSSFLSQAFGATAAVPATAAVSAAASHPPPLPPPPFPSPPPPPPPFPGVSPPSTPPPEPSGISGASHWVRDHGRCHRTDPRCAGAWPRRGSRGRLPWGRSRSRRAAEAERPVAVGGGARLKPGTPGGSTPSPRTTETSMRPPPSAARGPTRAAAAALIASVPSRRFHSDGSSTSRPWRRRGHRCRDVEDRFVAPAAPAAPAATKEDDHRGVFVAARRVGRGFLGAGVKASAASLEPRDAPSFGGRATDRGDRSALGELAAEGRRILLDLVDPVGAGQAGAGPMPAAVACSTAGPRSPRILAGSTSVPPIGTTAAGHTRTTLARSDVVDHRDGRHADAVVQDHHVGGLGAGSPRGGPRSCSSRRRPRSLRPRGRTEGGRAGPFGLRRRRYGSVGPSSSPDCPGRERTPRSPRFPSGRWGFS